MSGGVRTFALSRRTLERRRLLVAGFVLALLASLVGATPQLVAPTVLANGAPTTTIYVGDGIGSAPCDAPTFTTGDYASDDEAIQAALWAAATDGSSTHVVIHLCAGTYDLSAGISITSGDVPDVDITIQGDASTNTTVRLSPEASSTDFSLFTADDLTLGVDVRFAKLTLSGARATSLWGGAIFAKGGLSKLTVESTRFLDNQAGGGGGAIRAEGTLTVSDGTFAGNLAAQEGGAIHAQKAVLLRGSTFMDNTSGATHAGGAVYAYATLQVEGSRFSDNSSGADGGAIRTEGTADLTTSTFIGNAAGENGGAVSAGGLVSIDRGEFTANTSVLAGGAVQVNVAVIVASVFDENTAGTNGGAVFVPNGATLERSYFRRNLSGLDGGAIAGGSGPMSFADSTAGDNVAVDGYGGAISHLSDVNAEGSLFRGNLAGVGGGAIYSTYTTATTNARFVENTAGSGGAIFANAAVLTTSDFTANTATSGDGGGVSASNLVILDGGRFDRNSAAGSGGGIRSYVSVTTNRTDFSGNEATSQGGAIAAMTLGPAPVDVTGGTFAENTAGSNGGAIYLTGPATVDGAVFRDNSSGGSGGAVYSNGTVDLTGATFVRNTAPNDGGAIWSNDDARVTDSQLTDNTSGGNGGALFAYGGIQLLRSTIARNVGAEYGGAISAYGGSLDATNSTFVANYVRGGSSGGAIYADPDVRLTYSTFVDNSSETGYADAFYAEHDWYLDHVLMVGPVTDGTDCVGSGSGYDVGGNVETGTSCLGTTPTGPDSTSGTARADINLGTFQRHSGLTDTYSIVAGSVAIDVDTTTGCGVGTDQRGVTRPQSAGCDAGAYEVQGTVLAYTGPSVVYTTGDFANVTLTGSIYPALAGCDLLFSISDGSAPAFYRDATTGLKGSGSVTVYGLPKSVPYEVIVKADGDCTGIPDASGAFIVVQTGSLGKGTAGGGAYRVDPSATFSGRVKFAHVVSVSTVTKKVGKTSVTTTTTKGSLIWTYKNDWRLKATLNYSSTDGSATYAVVPCSSADFSTGGVTAPSGGVCARFSGAALLQVYDETLGWVASAYTKVTFVASVYDGGTKSTCTKNKCTSTEYPDWFGLTIRANNVPLGLLASPTPIPTSLMRSLQSPNGNGSLKAS